MMMDLSALLLSSPMDFPMRVQGVGDGGWWRRDIIERGETGFD
jgi:hypothetical protein